MSVWDGKYQGLVWDDKCTGWYITRWGSGFYGSITRCTDPVYDDKDVRLRCGFHCLPVEEWCHSEVNVEKENRFYIFGP